MADLSKLRFNGTDYNVKDASAPLRKFTNYSKTGNLPITSDDTTQTAIGKLEKALDDKINTSAKGAASGVAELDANGKVPSSQLPSYVDDVLEYSAKSSFPATGETGKIYVDTTTNKTYRWSGSAYVEISESLALGETSSTAYRGDRGKAAYDHSQITNGNPHGTTGANTNLTGYSKGSSKDAVAATDTVNAAIAKHENRINANQSNILYTIDTGVKNKLPGVNLEYLKSINSSGGVWSGNVYTYGSRTFTVNDDMSITVKGNSTGSSGYDRFNLGYVTANSGDILSGTPSGYNTNAFIYTAGGNTYNYGTDTEFNSSDVGVSRNITLAIASNYNVPSDGITFYPMVRSADTDSTYIRPALPNYDLTRLEAEDRAALAEEIDSGAKNIANIPSTQTISGITFTCDSNGYITSSASNDPRGWNAANRNVSFSVPKGRYIVYAETPSSNTGNVSAYVFENDEPNYDLALTPGSSRYIEINATSAMNIGIEYKPLANKVRYMICPKAAFGVSQKFVPYCKLSKIVANLTKTITTSATLDATGLQYTFSADASKYYRVTAWAKANGKNPEIIAIATTSDALLSYSAFPTDTTNACISTSCIINTGSSATIDVKVKYNGVGSPHYVGMIVEEL